MRQILPLISLIAAVAAGSAHAQTPVRGGSLTAIMDIQPASLDPIMGNGFNSDPNIYNLIYDKLITLDGKGAPSPQLAESWVLQDDLKSLTLKLRKGVVFHDGTPFNAEAVKFNLDRVSAAGSKAPASAFIGDVSSVEVIDPLTVKINLRSPSGPFVSVPGKSGTAILASLAIQPGMTISPTAFKADPDGYARKPVGTGPFKFVEWVGGDHLSVERNPSYWRTGADQKPLPYLDKVTVKFISNTSVKLVQLQSGSAQLGDAMPAKDWDKIKGINTLDLISRPQISNCFISFNTTVEPFNNKDLRLAIAYGVNRPLIEKVVTKGLGQVNATLWGPLDWIYDKSIKAPEYNLEKAKEHYKKSGHKGKLTLTVIQRDPDTQVAQLMQSQLKAVGIDLNVEVLERLSAMEKVNGKRYDFALLRGPSPTPDPDITFSAFYGRNARQNFSGQADEKLFTAVERARTTFQRDQRKRYYSEAQQLIVDGAYYVYLLGNPIFEVKRKELQGLKRESVGEWVLSEAWLSK